ncbi:putative C-S lyase [Phototrophicus methaneseepsis]|uniref:cysteine-S-conjugate beta-lyase n=1 Tax=Phototrophicus methaneseepsis TaxID=2710758 RepID=A0A7S8EBM9_9CHLR|nr:PatB family C-S lyase [Phototrophicus methaneseepsis]QPC83976.1 putative C-S lyase [Phototrophicus methaneseepsis]
MTATHLYDFDTRLNHRAQRSSKWSIYDEDVLPLWVADMDFKAAPAVLEALHARVEHGVFGYTSQSNELIETICARMSNLYDWEVKPEEVILIPGLVTGLMIAADAEGKAGDGVLTQTPVYGPFLNVPPERGRFVQSVDLDYVQDDAYTFHYEFDPVAFEAAITKQTSMLYFCNPHNPAGRIYSKEEIQQIADICERHNIIICSDEIHCDLLMDGNKHTPTASLSPEISQRTITLMAPSKTFNLAGLQGSFAIIQNKAIRERFVAAASHMHAYGWGGATLNIFAYEAALAAYQHGGEWLEAVLAYLQDNRNFARDYIKAHMPGVKTTQPSATYLLWIDCTDLDLGDQDAQSFFLKHARVGMNGGNFFGSSPAMNKYVRLNFACPREVLTEALERMAAAVQAL